MLLLALAPLPPPVQHIPHVCVNPQLVWRPRCTPARLQLPDEQPDIAATPPPPPAASLTDVAAGVALFVLLQSIVLSFGSAAGLSAGQDGSVAAGSRLVATGTFVAVQQAAGLPVGAWLVRDDTSKASSSPSSAASDFLQQNPAAAPAAALAFSLAVALIGTVAGLDWLPAARPLPDPGRAFDVLVTAPLTEEAFFRAWLLEATAAANAPPLAALAASAGLFSLWHLPELLGSGAGPAELVFFAALGGYLAQLYRTSGGSLPLVAGTHASFNLIVVLLRAVQ